MRTLPVWMTAAAATIAFAGAVQARPTGSIDCAVAAMSAKDQVRWGVALAGRPDASSKAVGAILDAVGPCARRNGWTSDQAGIVNDWTAWKILSAEMARQVKLGDADVAVLRGYIDEDPRRVEGLDHFTDAQAMQLLAELRKRGARLHDSGEPMKSELYVFYLQYQMKIDETKFAAS